MVSASDLLERKFIYPDDPYYKWVPLMAVWHFKCHKCGVYAISSSQIGVRQRLYGHLRRCEG